MRSTSYRVFAWFLLAYVVFAPATAVLAVRERLTKDGLFDRYMERLMFI